MSAPAPERTTGWPSVPKVLVSVIGARFGCYTATRFPGPSDPAGDVQAIAKSGGAVVRVVRLGGPRDRITDQARIAIDVIAGSEAQAEDLAELIAEWLIDDPAITDGVAMLDRVTVEVAPHPVPYTDPSVVQFSSTFVASSRRMG